MGAPQSLLCVSVVIDREARRVSVNQDDVALLVESEHELYHRLHSDLMQIEEIVTVDQICYKKAMQICGHA